MGTLGACVIVACSSGDAGSTAGRDASTGGGNDQVDCGALIFVPCVDGATGYSGCSGLTRAQACASHGGECDTAGTGCNCNDGTEQSAGKCNNTMSCPNICDGHCGFAGKPGSSCSSLDAGAVDAASADDGESSDGSGGGDEATLDASDDQG